MMTTKIIGTGSYIPETAVTNDDLAKVMETSDEWIRSRTGIAARHISSGEGTAFLATEAARRALADAAVDPAELDIIIVATSSADLCFPSTACEVQAGIGAVNAVAFDITAACSGFVFALSTVHGFIQSGIYKTALVIGAEVLSKLVDWSDRSTCVLFGDGAGAVVVKAAERGIIKTQMHSDGRGGDVLKCQARSTGNYLNGRRPELGYMTMDGQEVFKFAVKKVPETINQLLTESSTEIGAIKYFVMHQANARIFDSLARRMKIAPERIPSNIDKYGNTSAASIPLLLDELNREGLLEQGDKLVLAGFGGGLTWGSVLLEW